MNEQDLAAASREALLAQRDATTADLQKPIAALERRLAGRGSSGMPGNKPPVSKPKPSAKERKKRARGFGRPRMAHDRDGRACGEEA